MPTGDLAHYRPTSEGQSPPGGWAAGIGSVNRACAANDQRYKDKERAMKAVVFLGDSKIEVREYPDPKPGPDEVVLRVKASGMCGSDLHYLRSPKKSESEIFIAGHEPCGVVELVG